MPASTGAYARLGASALRRCADSHDNEVMNCGTWSALHRGMKPDKPTHRDANQGEGDRTSARHYNEQLRKFVDGGKVEPAARTAETYVEQMPEAAARAEHTAKRGPRGSSARLSLDELIGKARGVADRARPFVVRAIDRVRARLAHK